VSFRALNPATGKIVQEFPLQSDEQIFAALEKANKRYHESREPPEIRKSIGQCHCLGQLTASPGAVLSAVGCERIGGWRRRLRRGTPRQSSSSFFE
jgi:hypothetical protein